MNLPAEIRLQIYELLLVDDSCYMDMIKQATWPTPWTSNFPDAFVEGNGQLIPKLLTISLFRVSKTVSDEALPVFYGENTFLIPTFPLDNEWLMKYQRVYFDMIGMRNASYIRQVICLSPRAAEIACLTDPNPWGDYSQSVEEGIKEWYSPVGIRWDQLKVWVCKIADRWIGTFPEPFDKEESTFERLEEEEIGFTGQTSKSNYHWVAKRGCRPVGMLCRPLPRHGRKCLCECCGIKRVRSAL
jgi:hypothetical protein